MGRLPAAHRFCAMEHDPIRLIVGLGNPGPEHLATRHNVGFWFVDALARGHGGAFHSERKFHGELCRLRIDGQDIRMLKPMTYMNRSGLAIQATAAYFQIPPARILVVHDELDLPPGTVRLKFGGGPGGHNGLRDAISHMGRDFYRLRFGIGRPAGRLDVIDYVLHRPGQDDEDQILESLRDAVDVIPILLGHGDQQAMHKLHSRGVEPTPYRKEAGDEGEEEDDQTPEDEG